MGMIIFSHTYIKSLSIVNILTINPHFFYVNMYVINKIMYVINKIESEISYVVFYAHHKIIEKKLSSQFLLFRKSFTTDR